MCPTSMVRSLQVIMTVNREDEKHKNTLTLNGTKMIVTK